MKRVIYRQYGQPADVLELVEEDAGTPGAGEVMVRMEAAAMHIADLKNIRGEPEFRPPLPHMPGYEGIGRIAAVSKDAGGWQIGDRVFVLTMTGVWSEMLRVKAAGLIRAPEGDAVQLALLPLNPPTAYLILEDFAHGLKPGDWIIQNAANSSCGIYLAKLARLRGLRSVNVVRRESLFPLVHEAGGDVVLVDGPDLAERVRAATGGAPIRLGVDAVAGAATGRLAACLADDATLLNYGALAGEPCQIRPTDLFLHNIKLIGFWTKRQMAGRTPAAAAAVYEKMAALVADGTLRAQIAGVFPFSRVKDACALAAQVGDARPGKVILVPG